jgi:hypothetical protein
VAIIHPIHTVPRLFRIGIHPAQIMRARSLRDYLAAYSMRECPLQTQSPAMNLQGFTGLPLVVASFRHVTVTHAGLALPASVSGCRKLDR